VVALLVFITTTWHDLFPAIISDGRALPLGRYINSGIMLVDLLALIVLVRTCTRSILDLWLVVVVFALLAECTMMMFFVGGPNTFSFYAVRMIGLPVSKVVLIVLLWESMRLYANLAISHRELQHERASRLTNAATLMAAIAHEVRQPLAGINLLAYAGQQSLERPAPDSKSLKRLFREIKHAAGRANEVFDNFLRLTKDGRRDLQTTDVNALALEATSLMKETLDEHGVTTITQLAPGLPPVQCHAGQLREVLLNLIQNAVDAVTTTSAPRSITITTSHKGAGAISICLHDTGPGIDPDYLTTIFDPFVTTKDKGTGLGLAVCKMIIDQHGGKLSASCGKNGGARFEVMLPTRPAPTPLAEPEKPRAIAEAAP
jgi:signal transduction histidine kinase